MSADIIEEQAARLTRIRQAEKVTRMLCRRTGLVEGFEWRPEPRPYSIIGDRRTYTPKRQSHRNPPLPFHSFKHAGAGTCRVCGQPIYDGGGWRKPRGVASSRPTRLTWHSVCTTTYFVMTKPADYAAPLILLQGMKCATTGARIDLPYPKDIEVDHEVPLFRVAREHADEPWFDLIRYWMTGNLRAITREAHLAKCAAEAKERSGWKAAIGQEAML